MAKKSACLPAGRDEKKPPGATPPGPPASEAPPRPFARSYARSLPSSLSVLTLFLPFLFPYPSTETRWRCFPFFLS